MVDARAVEGEASAVGVLGIAQRIGWAWGSSAH